MRAQNCMMTRDLDASREQDLKSTCIHRSPMASAGWQLAGYCSDCCPHCGIRRRAQPFPGACGGQVGYTRGSTRARSPVKSSASPPSASASESRPLFRKSCSPSRTQPPPYAVCKGWRGPLVKGPPLSPTRPSSGSLLLSAPPRGHGWSPCGASPNHSALRPPMCGLVDELCCQHAARLNCQAGFPLAAPLSFQ